MTLLDLSIPFGLGLVSSLHCAQMCGPMVLAYSLPLQRERRSLVWVHLAYNAGRILTYALLGAVAGYLGGRMEQLGHLAGIERAAAIAVGIVMILAAALIGGWIPKQRLVKIGGSVPAAWTWTIGRLLKSPSPGSKLLLGISLGFLPCGLVYAALLVAVEAGSPLSGALAMVAFGAGTAGALVGIGMFSSAIASRLGRHANALASISIMLAGALLLWRGIVAPPLGGSCHHGL
jgi:uncharacterized protein